MPKINNENLVKISIDKVGLEGSLVIPQKAKAVIVFAHGSGSSRFSPRNQYVAKVLQKAGLATLLLDLLTKKEEAIDMATGHLRFDIEFLAARLLGAIKWLKESQKTKNLKIGCFGASTGAGAALIAAAKYPDDVLAVVSRGGRPDLVVPYLFKVKSPTLLIVGGDDEPVIEMNKEAMRHMLAVKKLEIVPGASHLFEEPGKLEKVAELAAKWFLEYLK